jgi:hypothetical protein
MPDRESSPGRFVEPVEPAVVRIVRKIALGRGR